MLRHTCAFISWLLVITILVVGVDRPRSGWDETPSWMSPLAITLVRSRDREARHWAFDVLQRRWPEVHCLAPLLPRESTAADRFFHELVADMLEEPEWGYRAARLLTCARVPGHDERVARCAAGIRVSELTAFVCRELVRAVSIRSRDGHTLDRLVREAAELDSGAL